MSAMFTAPSTGGLNFASRLSGACGWAKLSPCRTTSKPPATRSIVTASARPPKTFTDSGNSSSFVIFDKRIVIAADQERADPRLVQAFDLLGQEPGGLHRGLLAVVEVAGQQQRIDLLVDAEVDDPHESLPRGIADQCGELGVTERERTQRTIEMDVGGVDEAIGH